MASKRIGSPRPQPHKRSARVTDVIHQAFTVPFEYPVFFTRRVLDVDNPTLASVFPLPADGMIPARAMAFVDDGLVQADASVPDRLGACIARLGDRVRLLVPPQVLPGGEQAKQGWTGVQHVMTTIGSHHLCRHSYVIAVGGGSLLDMVGFAASLVHRGVRVVRLPTTVLAQNDAGVGVKTGMDDHGVKNFVGTFAPPHAVVIDFDFLSTLSQRDWIGGVAEAFKVAIIKDAAFFTALCRDAAALARRQPRAMESLVRRCARLHLDHIRTSGDPFELGTARPLDFGHWAAHRLESLSQYTLGHGQAVAVGISLDTSYAAAVGLITARERDTVLEALTRAGLPIWSSLLEGLDPVTGRARVLSGLDDFREHLGGRLTITLPRGIGGKVEVHTMDEAFILKCIEHLKRRHGATHRTTRANP